MDYETNFKRDWGYEKWFKIYSNWTMITSTFILLQQTTILNLTKLNMYKLEISQFIHKQCIHQRNIIITMSYPCTNMSWNPIKHTWSKVSTKLFNQTKQVWNYPYWLIESTKMQTTNAWIWFYFQSSQIQQYNFKVTVHFPIVYASKVFQPFRMLNKHP